MSDTRDVSILRMSHAGMLSMLVWPCPYSREGPNTVHEHGIRGNVEALL